MTNWIPLITLISGVAGVVVAWLALVKTKHKDDEAEGHSRGVIASDIGYIKAGVDDLKRENQEHRKAVSDLSQRVTRCEESCKQAHHRIDELKTNEQPKQ